MHRYKNLKVWQKAMDLAVESYNLSSNFPEEERFGLTQQLRRSAVSIPSNIAEGAGRSSDADFKRFLDIANGSINELETQILLSERLGFIDQRHVEFLSPLIAEVQKMNYAFSRNLIKK